MSIAGPLKSKINKLWEEFWTGGIANPLTVIEQISFLMFARLLDITETRTENSDDRTGKKSRRLFSSKHQHLRWGHFKNLQGEEMLTLVRDEVFPHFRSVALNGGTLAGYMKDAQLLIPKPNLLVTAVNLIDELPLTEGDTKGDLYEYLLSKLTTAGINGQFRTPRHIIRLMVEMLAPKPTDRICDPACGTAGFLVETLKYIYEKNTSPEGILDSDSGEKVYTGDLLTEHMDHIQHDLLQGFDFDATMLRISVMNLLLHGLTAPQITYQDTLSGSFPEKHRELAENAFDIVLANPPFKGSLDFDDVNPKLLSLVKTKKTELLFVANILRMLKPGGRCAMIVPDGVLFGSSGAHIAIRKELIENNQLEGVVSMPSGVFKPYAGVSTAILIFTKGGETKDVWFYKIENDGLSLDDKRTKVEGSDLPDVINRWNKRDTEKQTDRESKFFGVPRKEIEENKYDLSFNRYSVVHYEETQYDLPKAILARLEDSEKAIVSDLEALAKLLS